MSVKYARFSVSIHGLDCEMDFIKGFEGYLQEMVRSHAGGHWKSQLKFRDEYDSDVEVELEETAGEDPGYIDRVCKNCSHWRKETASTGGRCVCPKFKYAFTRSIKGDSDPDGVEVEFDEEWGLISGPEFGCIHYDERVMS